MINYWHLVIQLFHILLFGPFLIYVGLATPKENYIYNIILALGFFVILAFIIGIIYEPTISLSGWLIWHIVIISGLLLWCGFTKTETPSIIFSLLIALGFAAIGYHLTRLIQSYI